MLIHDPEEASWPNFNGTSKLVKIFFLTRFIMFYLYLIKIKLTNKVCIVIIAYSFLFSVKTLFFRGEQVKLVII